MPSSLLFVLSGLFLRISTIDGRSLEVLRELMLMKRLTQGQIAHLLGTQQSNVSALLTGRRKPNADQVATLSEFLGVDPSLFGEVKKARFKIPGEGKL